MKTVAKINRFLVRQRNSSEGGRLPFWGGNCPEGTYRGEAATNCTV